jgi:AraC family transcriptional regulator
MSSRLLKVANWEKLARGADFEAAKMASLCSISLRQVQRFFKQQFGQTPAAWLRDLKCRRAVALISRGCSTKAAAKKAGFASPSHCCHEFKKVYGVPPQSFAPGVRGGVECPFR